MSIPQSRGIIFAVSRNQYFLSYFLKYCSHYHFCVDFILKKCFFEISKYRFLILRKWSYVDFQGIQAGHFMRCVQIGSRGVHKFLCVRFCLEHRVDPQETVFSPFPVVTRTSTSYYLRKFSCHNSRKLIRNPTFLL